MQRSKKKKRRRFRRTNPELSEPRASQKVGCFHDEKCRNANWEKDVPLTIEGGREGHVHDHGALPWTSLPWLPPARCGTGGQTTWSEGWLCLQSLRVCFLPGEVGLIQTRCLIKTKVSHSPWTFF